MNQHFTFTLPKHWRSAFGKALDRMTKNGQPIEIRSNFELPFDRFKVEIYSSDDQVLQLGVYIGTELSLEK
jgi:hypothetical protein